VAGAGRSKFTVSVYYINQSTRSAVFLFFFSHFLPFLVSRSCIYNLTVSSVPAERVCRTFVCINPFPTGSTANPLQDASAAHRRPSVFVIDERDYNNICHYVGRERGRQDNAVL